MVLKTPEEETEVEPAEVPETRECTCGDSADIWDGRCRRCGLSG